MSMEDLSRALKSIDEDEYLKALAFVSTKQNRQSEARAMLDSFAEEYPALLSAGTMALVHIEVAGGDQRLQNAAATGALIAVMALKEMIDVAALNNIPTIE